jgi:imidazoleglycerol phosphate dehydratase HisB
MSRTADITRATGETDIRVSLALDGAGRGTRAATSTRAHTTRSRTPAS